MTVEEAILDACRAGDTKRRDALMVYAFERGVPAKKLRALTGLPTASSVAWILDGAKRSAVLGDPAPRIDVRSLPSSKAIEQALRGGLRP